MAMSKIKTWLSKIFDKGRPLQIVEDPKDPRDGFLQKIFGESNGSFLADIHSYAHDRKGELDEYKAMLKDGVTLAAINLIVEDATQLNLDNNMVAWVTSIDNPDFAKSMNDFLSDNLHVNDIIYTIAYNVVAYGECFLSTHYEDTEGYLKYFNLGDYFMVEEVDMVVHLFKYGVPLGYFRKGRDKDFLYAQEQILPEKSYIHFINNKGSKEFLSDPDDGLYIGYGTSFLEGAKYYYKQRQLLDDLILLSRLTRSSKYNLFKVEVGQATSQDTARMIREVKTAIQQRQEVSVTNEVFSSRNSPLLSGGNVYFPVRNGLGGVEVQQISDDPNVNSLKDIDYFNNNYYSALGVPQSFLGNTGDLPSGLGDSTLTQLDIRYARMIKRVQRVLKNGLRDLVIWKCLIDDVLPPDFEIEMTHILTAEDDRRSKVASDATQRIKDLFDMLQIVDQDIFQNVDKQKLLYFIFDALGANADTADIFTSQYQKEEDVPTEEPEPMKGFSSEEDEEEEMGNGRDESEIDMNPDIPEV